MRRCDGQVPRAKWRLRFRRGASACGLQRRAYGEPRRGLGPPGLTAPALGRTGDFHRRARRRQRRARARHRGAGPRVEALTRHGDGRAFTRCRAPSAGTQRSSVVRRARYGRTSGLGRPAAEAPRLARGASRRIRPVRRGSRDCAGRGHTAASVRVRFARRVRVRIRIRVRRTFRIGVRRTFRIGLCRSPRRLGSRLRAHSMCARKGLLQCELRALHPARGKLLEGPLRPAHAS
jgi:hypothetical protein